MTPQLHARRFVPAAAFLLLAGAASLWQPATAGAVAYTYSGSLDATDPSFNRPSSTTALSGVGTNVHYDVQPFFLTLADSVTLAVTAGAFTPGTADDSYLALYVTAFNPASPLTNLIAVDDDSGPGSLSLITTNLQAVTNYFLVTTTFTNAAVGTYSDAITPTNVANLVVVPEPSTWAMMAGGFGLLLVGQRFRRPVRWA